jgi:hypothetical protein
MHKYICAWVAWALVWAGTPVLAQTNQQELLQKQATVKESVARNQAALREYSWTERSVIKVKGAVTRTEVSTCRYRPDGDLQRTPLSSVAEPHTRLKVIILEKKYAAIEASIKRSLALLNQYLPPSPRQMSADHQAGNAFLGPAAPGQITLDFTNYLKSGDSLVFDFDSGTRSLRKILVNTYLDEPKDPVTVLAGFDSLPDALNHISTATLSEKDKGIQIAVQTSNYQKLEP